MYTVVFIAQTYRYWCKRTQQILQRLKDSFRRVLTGPSESLTCSEAGGRWPYRDEVRYKQTTARVIT
ncbi:unnamed protein product [Pieris brassicae]|uniref:Uncharacterized protein n=1 Tax=Pieris brassicae TaxID=7116 RepID=A0A9P0TEF6_PIEBR|nr:unnamed protein product [Pieris brassicae]